MPDSEPMAPVVSIDKGSVTRKSVTVTGSFTDKASGITEYGFQMAEGSPENWKVIANNPPKDGTGRFSHTVEGLVQGRDYYFRTFISNGSTVKYSPASEAVQTLPNTVASVTEVSLEGCVLSASIEDDGGRAILSVGFLGGVSSTLSEITQKGIEIPAVLDADGKHFSARVGNEFELGETYYFVAYAENAEDALHTYKGYSPKALSVTVNDAFPAKVEDPAFAEYLVAQFDSDKDGMLSWAELRAVTAIDVTTDKITSIQEIALMPELQYLSCRGSSRGTGKLTALDISQNPELTYLDCAQNKITRLDLEHNGALRTLDVGGNPLTVLDINSCENLQTFNARGCTSLKQILVWVDFDEAGHPDFSKEYTTAYVCSPSAAVPIADAIFRDYCVASFDLDKNGKLSVDEAAAVQAISVSTDEIASLEGLAYFTGLQRLSCCGTQNSIGLSNGRLKTLDLSGNPGLTELLCENNQLATLDLSGLTGLTTLDCSANLLTKLDIRNNKRLSQLDCSDNPLTEICLLPDQSFSQLKKPESTKLLYQLNGLSLTPEELVLEAGETAVLTVVIDPETAVDRDGILAGIAWTSSDESVAIVNHAGEVTAVGYGQCSVTAVYDEHTATCSVSVSPLQVTSITLDLESCELLVEETVQLLATLLPESAAGQPVTWESSQPEIATVSEAGLVTAVSVGTCTITASSGDQKATCSVTVSPILVTAIEIDPVSRELSIGESFTIAATVLPSNATDPNVQWRTSDETVATVSSSGEVTAVGVGSCVITASVGEVEAACEVTVLSVPVSSVMLDCESWRLMVGDSFTLHAQVLPSYATFTAVSWQSSDSSVAMVDEDGVVTALSAGICTITAEADGQSAGCELTVTATAIPVTSLSLNRANMALSIGDVDTLTAAVLPVDATYKTVSWSSDNESVATITDDGVVTGVSMGACTLTAKVDGCQVTCPVVVGPIPITSSFFPDERFREYISTYLDPDEDGFLFITELAAITVIEVEDMSLKTLQGIEFFFSLTTLHCSGNQLTSLDVSSLTRLTELMCDENPSLKDIWLSSGQVLTTLTCDGTATVHYR